MNNQRSHQINGITFSFVFFLILIFFIVTANLYTGIEKAENTQDKELFLEILYLANLNGNIVNCDCGDPSLGGLPQIATIIKDSKMKNSGAIFIDGGDFLNTYPFRKLNNSVTDIYTLLRPDILCLGDQEFIESEEFTMKLVHGLCEGIIASNFRYKPEPEKIHSSLILSLGADKKVGFLSYLSQESFTINTHHQLLQFDNALFNQEYDKLRLSNFCIVLFHGTSNELNNFIRDYPETDLILFAHEQSYLSDVKTHPAIVGGGVDGENLMQIRIFETSGEFQIEVNRIPVLKEIKPDPEISLLVQGHKN